VAGQQKTKKSLLEIANIIEASETLEKIQNYQPKELFIWQRLEQVKVLLARAFAMR